jgi:transcription initiation factor TFIIH subunit 4
LAGCRTARIVSVAARPTGCRRRSSLPLAGISQRGFQFLLSDLYSQLWAVVRQYLLGLQAAGGQGGDGDLAVAANFLLRLGLQGGGAPMSYSQLGRGEQSIAAHMCQMGLLMPAPRGGQLWLHPTRLAAVLAGGGRGGEAAAAQEEGHVIVESNFRCGWKGEMFGRVIDARGPA